MTRGARQRVRARAARRGQSCEPALRPARRPSGFRDHASSPRRTRDDRDDDAATGASDATTEPDRTAQLQLPALRAAHAAERAAARRRARRQAAARRPSSRWSTPAPSWSGQGRRAWPRSPRSCCSRAQRGSTARRSPSDSSGSAPRSTRTPTGTAATVSLTALAERLPEALALVREVLRAPEFPEREVERLKAERLAELLQQRAEPRGLADEQFARVVVRADSRYARPQAGGRDERARADARRRARLLRSALSARRRRRWSSPATSRSTRATALARRAVRRLERRRRTARSRARCDAAPAAPRRARRREGGRAAVRAARRPRRPAAHASRLLRRRW